MATVRSGPPAPDKALIDRGVPSWIAMVMSSPSVYRDFMKYFDEWSNNKQKALRHAKDWEEHVKVAAMLDAIDSIKNEVQKHERERRAEDGLELAET